MRCSLIGFSTNTSDNNGNTIIYYNILTLKLSYEYIDDSDYYEIFDNKS